MKLESQVTSLEISKRLRELGAKQESLFWWTFSTHGVTDENGHTENAPRQWEVNDTEKKVWYGAEAVSAYTVAELGEMLNGLTPMLSHDKKWYWRTYPNNTEIPFIVLEDIEADARGRMLIYLLENGLIPRPIGESA